MRRMKIDRMQKSPDNVFLPLRGWTLRDKPLEDSIESLKDFMLRGLGVIR